jgi:hypothetical protein
VIFSDPAVSAFIRNNYVAAWENVRPVPVVVIDFGNGAKLKRTVNGNIATYLCAPDGRVLDIIPGLNEPKAYLEALREGLRLHRVAPEAVLVHHAARLMAPVRPILERRDVGKAVVEMPVKHALLPRNEAELLAADTEINQRERKPLLHGILAEKAWRPADLTKRVYKDVLHVDLDDPFLGLVTAAFGGGAYGSR